MQKIDLHNYEAWMLDAAEGKLSGEGLEALKTFLAMHPELNNFDDEALPVLEPETVSFSHTLLKNETVCIDYVEGLLNEAQKKAVEEDDSLILSLKLYKATRLEPDLNIVFPDKKALLKQPRIITLFNPKVFRAAAAIFIFAGLLWILPDSKPLVNSTKRISGNTFAKNATEKSPIQVVASTNSVDVIKNSQVKKHYLLQTDNAVASVGQKTSDTHTVREKLTEINRTTLAQIDSMPTPTPGINNPHAIPEVMTPVTEAVANVSKINQPTLTYTSLNEIAVDNDSDEELTADEWKQYMVKKDVTRSKTIYGRLLSLADNAIAAGKKILHFDNRTHGYAFAVRDLKVEKH